MKPITFPIFVIGRGSFDVFFTPEDVARDLEHYDVDDDEYHGYDYHGRPLKFLYHGEFNLVYCELASSEPDHDALMAEIHDLLIALAYTPFDPNDHEATKAIAVGLTARTFWEYQTLWQWIKSFFVKAESD